MVIGLDFDGTVLDSSFRHILALHKITNKDIGMFHDFVAYKSEGPNGLLYLQKKGFDDANDIFTKWIEVIEDDEFLKYDVLYSDSLYFLENLSKRNDIYLVSARNNTKGLIKQVNNLKIGSFFQEIIAVEKGMTKYELTKNIKFDCIIGDTENDYEWASQFKANFYALNRGFRSQSYWDRKNIESFKNLLEIMNKIKENKK